MIGAISAGGIMYLQTGLPIPATTHYVDTVVRSIKAEIRPIQYGVLETQRKTLRADRNFLRNEQSVLGVSLARPTLDPADRVILTRRLTEIEDQLRILEREEIDVIAELKKINQ